MKLRNKKTGESGELHYYPDKEYHFAVSAKDPTHTRIYKTLGELLQDWEDFIVNVPAEPLIKHPDIRKALRAWAYVQRIKEVRYVEGIASSDFRHLFEYGGRGSNRGVIHWGKGVLLSGLEDGKTYTITELCGEEEE